MFDNIAGVILRPTVLLKRFAGLAKNIAKNLL